MALRIYAKYATKCKKHYGDKGQYSYMTRCPYCGGEVNEANVYYLNDVGDVGEADYVCERHGVVGYWQYGYTEIRPNIFREYLIEPVRLVWHRLGSWLGRLFKRKKTSQLTADNDDLPF